MKKSFITSGPGWLSTRYDTSGTGTNFRRLHASPMLLWSVFGKRIDLLFYLICECEVAHFFSTFSPYTRLQKLRTKPANESATSILSKASNRPLLFS